MYKRIKFFLKPIFLFYKIIKDYLISFLLKLKITDKQKFTLIYKSSYWQNISSDSNSKSGVGSDKHHVKNIIRELSYFLKKNKIKSLLDIPCGDCSWIFNVNLDKTKYFGADIVKELVINNKRKFKKKVFLEKDLSKDKLKFYDLIIVRDCFVHLNNVKIFSCLNNIIDSKSKYLASTIFVNNYNNLESKLADNWRPINLCHHPFNLPKPKFLLDDTFVGNNFDRFKYLAIWEIKNLKKKNV